MSLSLFRVTMLRLTALQDGIASRAGAADASHDGADQAEPTNWYLIETKARKERLVLKALGRKVPFVFLPLREFIEIVNGRRKRRESPLFPSHVFVALSRKQSVAEVRYTAGLRNLVSPIGQLVPVPATFMEELRRFARVSGGGKRAAWESDRPAFPRNLDRLRSLIRGDASDDERIAILFGTLGSAGCSEREPA